MKVVILNTAENKGGAAIAANRLMHALRKKDIEAKMLVRDKTSDEEYIISVSEGFFCRKKNIICFLWERLVIFFYNKFNKKDLFRVSIANIGNNLSQHSIIKDADIIHLHWINHGFLSLTDIQKILSLGKPVVWTMHDMWACTGICHHSRDCNNFQEKCGYCFFLNSKNKKDLSAKTWQKKQQMLQYGSCYFVTCSNWLRGKAVESSLLKEKNIIAIPNPINTDIFNVFAQNETRTELGLPTDKKLLLFGAFNITDERKGIHYLISGLKFIQFHYPEIHKNIELVVFGQVKSEIQSLLNVPIRSMGYLHEDEKIAKLYNAVDLFVTSSLEENLPNTIMEAMSCGTPCVGFDIGGIPEMIDHKENGYVAKYKSAEDLADGIVWVLNNENQAMLSQKARDKVLNTYSQQQVANQYITLYNSILRANKNE